MTGQTLDSALWYLGRGTGAVALVMLTIALCLGIATRSGRSIATLSRFGIADLHRTASLTGATLIAAHVSLLMFDPYAQLKITDVVLPFLGSYRPLYLGLGTLGLDVLLVLVASSLLRQRIGPRVFKAVHRSAYLMWPLALAHAIGIGTDRATGWFVALAAGCTAAVLTTLSWRLSAAFAERGWRRLPRKVLR